MATYNKPILIQKQNKDEKWEDYYNAHANINKTSGKEYISASSNISSSTFDFKIRFCEKAKDIIFNTEIFRIIYEGKIFDIKNVDRYAETKTEINIVGTYNG